MSRVAKRPLSTDWPDDAPMTLAEIVAVFADHYPVTVSGLRREIKRGRLPFATVLGRHFITPTDLRKLFAPCPVNPKDHAYTYEKGARTEERAKSWPTAGSSETAYERSARAAARTPWIKLNKHFRST